MMYKKKESGGCRVADKIRMMAFLRMGCCIPIIYRGSFLAPFFFSITQ